MCVCVLCSGSIKPDRQVSKVSVYTHPHTNMQIDTWPQTQLMQKYNETVLQSFERERETARKRKAKGRQPAWCTVLQNSRREREDGRCTWREDVGDRDKMTERKNSERGPVGS